MKCVEKEKTGKFAFFVCPLSEYKDIIITFIYLPLIQ